MAAPGTMAKDIARLADQTRVANKRNQEPSMSTTTRQTNVPLWHFQCPECGMGDGEMGHHA